MFNTYVDKIHEIINKHCVRINEYVAKFDYKNFHQEFNCRKNTPYWKGMKNYNENFYNDVIDTIFDEIHPY